MALSNWVLDISNRIFQHLSGHQEILLFPFQRCDTDFKKKKKYFLIAKCITLPLQNSDQMLNFHLDAFSVPQKGEF